MALWDSLTNKTNPTALAFNRMLNNKTIDAVSRLNGLLYKILGKPQMVGRDTKTQELRFSRVAYIDGVKQSIRHMGAVASVTYPASRNDEVATATLATNGAIWGESEFSLAHSVIKYAVPNSEWALIDGDSKKGASLMDEYAQFFEASIRKEISSSILSANAPALTTIGGIVYAIDDGGSTTGPAYVENGATGGNASYKMYGTLDRSASGNEIFCPYVGANTGEMTVPAIQKGINRAVANGGNPTVCPVGPTLYDKAQALAREYVQVNYDKEWDRFGGKYVNIGGVDFVLEGGTNAPTNVLTFIDPETWVLVLNNRLFDVTWDEARDLTAARRATVEYWIQFLCKQPAANSKLTGVTV